MSMKCWMSKGDLITMLGSDATTFMLFLLKKPKVMQNFSGLTEEQQGDIDDLIDVINQMFALTPSSGIEVDEPIIQGMISQLQTLGIISQDTVDRINQWISAQNSTVEYPESVYRLDKVVNGSEYDEIWVDQNALPIGVSKTIVVNIDNYMITLNGTLPSPAVKQEV